MSMIRQTKRKMVRSEVLDGMLSATIHSRPHRFPRLFLVIQDHTRPNRTSQSCLSLYPEHQGPTHRNRNRHPRSCVTQDNITNLQAQKQGTNLRRLTLHSLLDPVHNRVTGKRLLRHNHLPVRRQKGNLLRHLNFFRLVPERPSSHGASGFRYLEFRVLIFVQIAITRTFIHQNSTLIFFTSTNPMARKLHVTSTQIECCKRFGRR